MATYYIEVPIGTTIIEDDDEYEQRRFSYTYHGRYAMQRMELPSSSIVPLQTTIYHRLAIKDIAADKTTCPLFVPPNVIRKKHLFDQPALFTQLEDIAVIARLHDKRKFAQFNAKDAMQHMELPSSSIVPLQSTIYHRISVKDIAVDNCLRNNSY